MENIELTGLAKEDFDDVVHLLDNVFSVQNGTPMDFKSAFPRIFVPKDETMGWHLGAKINGRLCGVAASYPLTYRVGGTDLKISAGGNVAVDASVRGRGIMQRMLNKIDEEDRAAGFDLSYLHGDRFRYRNFGYERCGVEYHFTLTRQMLGKAAPTHRLAYVDLRTANEALVQEVFAFYNSQPAFLVRAYDAFLPALCTKKRLPLAVLSEEGALIAYLTVGQTDGCIGEICLQYTALFSDVLKGYMEAFNADKLFLGMPAYDPLAGQAHRVADRYHIMQPGNFKIYNFQRVVESFLREKARHESLPDGEVTIDSEIFGVWKIKKAGDTISAAPYTGQAKYALPGYSVYPFLFGTLPPQAFADSDIDEPAKAWFPLPLYCPYLT